MKISRTGTFFSALPNALMVSLFFSLGMHMRQTLGDWPHSIGEAGFPPSLITHANVTQDCFVILLLAAVFIAPAAAIVCWSVRRWKQLALYFALFTVLFLLCWGLMQLAPEPFLNWWGD